VRLVSACADHDCGWVFLDRSRNRTRRWCSSGERGNRNRVRIYNARHAPAQAVASRTVRNL
jgi:predicted RNA-binding Zn ribbon-like protein